MCDYHIHQQAKHTCDPETDNIPDHILPIFRGKKNAPKTVQINFPILLI